MPAPDNTELTSRSSKQSRPLATVGLSLRSHARDQRYSLLQFTKSRHHPFQLELQYCRELSKMFLLSSHDRRGLTTMVLLSLNLLSSLRSARAFGFRTAASTLVRQNTFGQSTNSPVRSNDHLTTRWMSAVESETSKPPVPMVSTRWKIAWIVC